MFLFVYGTLKRGHRNNHYLDNATFVGEYDTSPHYRLFDNGSYPMMVEEDRAGYSISGEIWEVDDEDIGVIDDHELFYLRKLIDVPGFTVKRWSSSGWQHDTEPVWAYIYTEELHDSFQECYGMWG